MDLSVVFLGTGPSAPTSLRNTACTLIRRGGDRILVDCGEGSQRQLARSGGLVALDEVYLTHLHADHFLGLPGLLKTYDLQSREEPLDIYGPPGTRSLFATLTGLVGRTAYTVRVEELGPSDWVGHDGFSIGAFPVEHRGAAYGYTIAEDERPGEFDPAAARARGVPEGPLWGELQRGQTVEVDGAAVAPELFVGPARAGRKIVLTGDTRPCEATVQAATEAQLLVHDSSFMEEDGRRAVETAHSTAREAGRVAAEAGVSMLALVHISSRYNVRHVRDEARLEFGNAVAPRDFDVVEVPFPERGDPALVSEPAAVPVADG